VPRGLESLCRSGSNPIVPGEIVARLKAQTLGLQQQRAPVQQEVG
jgi:hypothetical protein